MMKTRLLVYFLVFVTSNFYLISQEKDKKDTVIVHKIPDSLLSVPLRTHGQTFQGKYEPYRKISKNDIQMLNYLGLNDIISAFTPFYSQHLGGYSTYNSFSVFGANSKSISFGFNGRNINDLDLGSLNPDQYPTESFENIEIWTGADAAVLGDNAPAAYINFQEIRYNTETPFTRIWFGNSGFGYLGVDGIYSQNIMPDWNFTFGFRSFDADGSYQNSWSNNWNVRGFLRWNPDNRTSISFTENFTNSASGTNGGLNTDTTNNLSDVLEAVPNFAGLNERTFRHDMTLSATHRLDNENTNSLALNLYLSDVNWERSSGSNLQFIAADTNSGYYRTGYTYAGAEGRYELDPVDAVSLRIGANTEIDMLDRTYMSDEFNGVSSSVFGHASIRFIENFNISGGMRLFSKFGKVGIAYGVKQNTMLTDKLKFTADFSYSDRLPYPIEGLGLNSEQHVSVTGEIDYELQNDTRLTFGAYFRTVFSPILASLNSDELSYDFLRYFNGGNITRIGGYAEAETEFMKNFTLKAKGLIQYGVSESGAQLEDFPLFNGAVRLFYTYQPGRSILRGGVYTGIITGFTGDKFFPLQRTFYPGDYQSGLMVSGLNVFLEIKIGKAFVKISYENLLNQTYYYIAVNPMFRRNLRLSVNWAFLED